MNGIPQTLHAREKTGIILYVQNRVEKYGRYILRNVHSTSVRIQPRLSAP